MKTKIQFGFKKLVSRGNFAVMAVTILAVSNLLLASYLSVNVYRESVRQPSKIVSLMNLYFEPVRVEVLGESHSLNLFDIKVVQHRTTGDIPVEVFSESGELIESFNIKGDPGRPLLTIKPISKEYQYCFFAADVEDFYAGVAEPELKNINYADQIGSSYFSRNYRTDINYVYPGKARSSDLPPYAQEGTIRGVYPIECGKQADRERLIYTVQLYQNYSPALQREYYNEQISEIESLTL